MFHKSLCINCHSCDNVCTSSDNIINLKKGIINDCCPDCFMCIDACPTGALKKVGRNISVKSLIDEVLKDKIYYDTTGGGITISGGEPFFNQIFVLRF